MAKVSLTRFQADWLHTVICTCHDIAIDSLEHVEGKLPKNIEEDGYDAWEAIVAKVAAARD